MGFVEGLMRAIVLGFHRALAVRAVRARFSYRCLLAAFSKSVSRNMASIGRRCSMRRPIGVRVSFGCCFLPGSRDPTRE
jgi:hypothetical protein